MANQNQKRIEEVKQACNKATEAAITPLADMMNKGGVFVVVRQRTIGRLTTPFNELVATFDDSCDPAEILPLFKGDGHKIEHVKPHESIASYRELIAKRTLAITASKVEKMGMTPEAMMEYLRSIGKIK